MNNKYMDEREIKLTNRTMAIAGLMAYLYGIILMAIKLIILGSFRDVYFEFGLVLLMTLTIFVSRKVHKDYDIPTTIFGKQLPTEYSREEKRTRVTNYSINALSFSMLYVCVLYYLGFVENLFNDKYI